MGKKENINSYTIINLIKVKYFNIKILIFLIYDVYEYQYFY